MAMNLFQWVLQQPSFNSTGSNMYPSVATIDLKIPTLHMPQLGLFLVNQVVVVLILLSLRLILMVKFYGFGKIAV